MVMVDQLQSCSWLSRVERGVGVGLPGTAMGSLLLLTSLEAFHLPFQPSEHTLNSSTPRAHFRPYTRTFPHEAVLFLRWG